jgi:hypothetical protein
MQFLFYFQVIMFFEYNSQTWQIDLKNVSGSKFIMQPEMFTSSTFLYFYIYICFQIVGVLPMLRGVITSWACMPVIPAS